MSQAGGFREYGMALADMPLPLLCMRPIFAKLFGKTVAMSDDQRGILVGNTKDKRGGFATLGHGGVRSRFGTDLIDFSLNFSNQPTAGLYCTCMICYRYGCSKTPKD